VDDAIHEVEVTAIGMAANRVRVVVERAVGLVGHLHVRLRGDESKLQLGKDAERPKRSMHHLEDERVLVVRSAPQDGPVAGEHLVFEAGVMKPTMTKRHRLEGASRHGAADGDRLELGDDGGDETELERLLDELDERDTRLCGAGTCDRIDLEDVVKVAEIDRLLFAPRVAALRNLMRHGALFQRERLRADVRAKLLRETLYPRAMRPHELRRRLEIAALPLGHSIMLGIDVHLSPASSRSHARSDPSMK